MLVKRKYLKALFRPGQYTTIIENSNFVPGIMKVESGTIGRIDGRGVHVNLRIKRGIVTLKDDSGKLYMCDEVLKYIPHETIQRLRPINNLKDLLRKLSEYYRKPIREVKN